MGAGALQPETTGQRTTGPPALLESIRFLKGQGWYPGIQTSSGSFYSSQALNLPAVQKGQKDMLGQQETWVQENTRMCDNGKREVRPTGFRQNGVTTALIWANIQVPGLRWWQWWPKEVRDWCSPWAILAGRSWKLGRRGVWSGNKRVDLKISKVE